MNELQPDVSRSASLRPDEDRAMREALAAVWRIAAAGTHQEVWDEAASALQRLTGSAVICLAADRAGQLVPTSLESISDAKQSMVDQIVARLTDAWRLEDGPSLVSLEHGRILAMHCADTRTLRGGLVLLAPAGESLTTGDQGALALIALAAGHTLGAIAMRAASVPLDRHEAALARQRTELSHTLHAGPAQDLAMTNMALEHLLGASANVEPSTADAGRIALAYVRLAGENLRQFMARLRGEPVDATRFHAPAQRITSFFPGIGQEDAILAIVREAIRNSRAHARADTLSVTITRGQGDLSVQISDDGQGFTGPPPAGHFGLAEMRELAEGLGGEIVIASAPGKGTTIRFTVPEPSDDSTRHNGTRPR